MMARDTPTSGLIDTRLKAGGDGAGRLSFGYGASSGEAWISSSHVGQKRARLKRELFAERLTGEETRSLHSFLSPFPFCTVLPAQMLSLLSLASRI